MVTMPNLRIRVFGSRASGENRKNSDIDVLVEGPGAEIERVKDALRKFSIEQGGPLDLFVLGAVDNEIDLISAYAAEGELRSVAIGDEDDLDEMLSSAFDTTLEALQTLCETVDPIWNQSTSMDRTKEKSAKSRMRP